MTALVTLRLQRITILEDFRVNPSLSNNCCHFLSLHTCLYTSNSLSWFTYKSFKLNLMAVLDSKLTLGVSVSTHGCLSLCGPVKDWRPVQDVPPNGAWDRLQPKWPQIITKIRFSERVNRKFRVNKREMYIYHQIKQAFWGGNGCWLGRIMSDLAHFMNFMLFYFFYSSRRCFCLKWCKGRNSFTRLLFV